MRDASWDRPGVITSLKRDIWRHLTQTARTDEELALEASRLLQMPDADVLVLAQLQFVLSEAVGDLLDQMPSLSRRLSTTTVLEREQSADRIRGSIRWSETFAARAASGLPHLHVTKPNRRAYDTPENRLLTFALEAIARFGKLTGWSESTSVGVGEIVRERVSEAVRWRRTRALLDVPADQPSDAAIARVRAGRRRRAYSAVLAAIDAHRDLIARLDRNAIKEAVENHALVTRKDPVLLELLALFRALEALERLGWTGSERRLIQSGQGDGQVFSAEKDGYRLALYYQRTPPALVEGSRYRAIQKAHDFSRAGPLMPDLVAQVTAPSEEVRWVLVEVKGVKRKAAASARAAIRDLLTYRRAFEDTLAGQAGAYGIGVAWGEAVRPGPTSEILVCSPDTLPEALEHALP